jgi:hypothetical protein
VIDNEKRYQEDIIEWAGHSAMICSLNSLRECYVAPCYIEYGLDIFVEIKKIVWTMAYLRRTFYTASYRGSQIESFEQHLNIAKEIVKYCEEKLKDNG